MQGKSEWDGDKLVSHGKLEDGKEIKFIRELVDDGDLLQVGNYELFYNTSHVIYPLLIFLDIYLPPNPNVRPHRTLSRST